MNDKMFFEQYFSAEELSAIQTIMVREAVKLAEKDSAILGQDYFFVGAEKLA